MTTLAEIEDAIGELPADQRWELFGTLKARLLGENGPMPEPRDFPPAQVRAWIEEDEADLRRLRQEWAAAGLDENGRPRR